MDATRETVRFWTRWNGGWVKVTITGTDVPHTLYRSAPTDEGWHSEEETYTLTVRENEDGTHEDVIVCEMITDGRDCDGRHSSRTVVECPVSKLKALETTPGKYADDWERKTVPHAFQPLMAPAWERVSARQRDYAAEAMGY